MLMTSIPPKTANRSVGPGDRRPSTRRPSAQTAQTLARLSALGRDVEVAVLRDAEFDEHGRWRKSMEIGFVLQDSDSGSPFCTNHWFSMVLLWD